MNINTSIKDGRAVIAVTEDAVHKDYAEILPALEKAGQLDEVAFDLKQMYYIMSSQIAELLGVKKWAAKGNIPVALLNVNPGVYQVLEMTNLLNLFIIRQDYSCYSLDELMDMFNSPENADAVSAYLSSPYT